MRDITLEETIYMDFTTRAFASGVPTTLAGTPVLSVLEENNVTPITAGVSVSVDRASVTGLNMATIVATAANGYEDGKGYSVYISTGTVGGVSVIGEIVAQFTIGASAAFARLGAPAGASVSADIADVPTVAEFNARTLVAASYFDPAADTVVNVTNVAVTTTNSDMRGTNNALLAASINLTAGAVDDVTTVGSVTGAVGSVTGNVGGNVTGSVGSLVGQTPQTGDSYLLLTGAQAEPTGVPAANETIADKIAYLFAGFRNKLTVTSTKKQYFDDAGVAMWEKDLSDSGTTYEESEANLP